MGIIYNQENNRSDLQKRLAQELSEKAKKKTTNPDGKLPDGVDDSAYIEGTKKTTSLAWVWLVIFIAIIVASVWYFVALILPGNDL
jgi:hypothetical protein